MSRGALTHCPWRTADLWWSQSQRTQRRRSTSADSTRSSAKTRCKTASWPPPCPCSPPCAPRRNPKLGLRLKGLTRRFGLPEEKRRDGQTRHNFLLVRCKKRLFCCNFLCRRIGFSPVGWCSNPTKNTHWMRQIGKCDEVFLSFLFYSYKRSLPIFLIYYMYMYFYIYIYIFIRKSPPQNWQKMYLIAKNISRKFFANQIDFLMWIQQY